ncbi:hypothetical protein EV132_1296 [Rhizobium sullae]|uniref:Uncharacterized protein n=1 Tax=Rhizobium sullae TaxID=50338 RepID=A0A4R3PWS4_RHISU|nr:hypothetical protein EV132_1296 [Rhizobium sullae]
MAVEVAGIGLSSAKIRIDGDAGKQAGIGCDRPDLDAGTRGCELRKCGVAVRPIRNDLGNHRVIEGGDFIPLLDAAIDKDCFWQSQRAG